MSGPEQSRRRPKRWLQQQWPPGQAAALACCLEAAAPKAGNVTPSMAFRDMDFSDFVVGGLALSGVFDNVSQTSIGQLVYDGVAATRNRLDVNTHLGAILLMAPLAKALTDPRSQIVDMSTIRASVRTVLSELTARDAELVYAAIRLAKPGGLGQTDQHDVRADVQPQIDLRRAMAMVSEFDAVARQYVNDFEETCELMVVWLQSGLDRGLDILQAITEMQLRWMAADIDGLIYRKAGREIALEAQHLAQIAFQEWLETGECGSRWHALDSFLRADGNARNPGTTADLIAAALFVELARPKTNASHQLIR